MTMMKTTALWADWGPIMDFIIDNWVVIVAAIAVLVGVVIAVVKFVKSGRETQLSNLKEWLLFATVEAEKALGAGTGKLKLRAVYDMFVAKFSWLAKIISFERFSGLVDEALETMNNMLSNNVAVQHYVNGVEEEPTDEDVEG